MGMQPEWILVAAQDAAWWAQKFALRLTWLADQLDVGGIIEYMWDMVEAIRQYWVMDGFWSARVTVRESPSKIKEEIPIERANKVAKRAALASPIRAEHGGLIRELQWIKTPEKFLMTAAWAEKEGRIAVS
jgi:hypothetical protein